MLPGTYKMKKKDGTEYYKASITYMGQHISLGSYTTERKAALAYERASKILFSEPDSKAAAWTVDSYRKYGRSLPFDKWVMLINFRDNKLYCRNAIYLKKRYFIYYLDQNTPLKFDVDDLFYYRNHKIMRRGGHLFVADYGMQVNILSRYGIKNYAVSGKDYIFVNGDCYDYRYGNIEIINHYHGVRLEAATDFTKVKRKPYVAKIHIVGDTIVGRYATEDEAAIAYNKAADKLEAAGVEKKFPRNYIENMKKDEYLRIYEKVKLSEGIIRLLN